MLLKSCWFHLRSLSLLAILATQTKIGLESSRGDTVSFAHDVKPILASRCYSCHGPDANEGGLRLHEQAATRLELESGHRAIVPNQPDQSGLLARVTSEDPDERMPPDGKALTADEIERLREWIASGAVFEKHWAFVPPKSLPPPQVEHSDWIRNPIDAFLVAKLQAVGLSPNPPADKRALARRLYYDLTGLPPTVAQLQEFLADDAPDAYERLVDRLLASPHYGERWARHWLDLVRYAETNSFERDSAKPFAWKYRDYVIRSLNDDKPYDQFIIEQLAGDELENVTPESIAATGYYRLGVWDDEPADPLQAKYNELDNVLTTTSQAFLGLTIGCARCHDHKIDPIPQTDYYGMLAFFADVTPYALPHQRDARFHSLWDLSPPNVQRRRDQINLQLKEIRKKKRKIEKAGIANMDAALQRRTETREREKVLKEHLHRHLKAQQIRDHQTLATAMDRLEQQLSQLPQPEVYLSLAKCEPRPKAMHVMLRGNPHVEGDRVEPHYPQVFGDERPRIPAAPEGARTAGRRIVLAKWIASPENPLTSRVIVNRIWQHHFGRGIVRSASNFGQIGSLPTHTELLDWLANWLVAHDWRLKPLNRMIVTSNAYRMSSRAQPQGLAQDPDNDLFWRFNMRRLSAEEIRDSVLLTTGQLNDEVYGPSVYPKLSQEVLHTQSRPGDGWHTSDPRQAARRSIYIHVKRSLIPPSLANFDFPDPDSSCEARFNTTQAAQALNLLHGEFLQSHASHLARQVQNEVDGDLPAQVVHALRLVLQREPEEDTVLESLQLTERYQSDHQLSPEEALRQVCLMALNLNEFVYVD